MAKANQTIPVADKQKKSVKEWEKIKVNTRPRKPQPQQPQV
jgi:hypothetical protein